jgi:hypothetical protein
MNTMTRLSKLALLLCVGLFAAFGPSSAFAQHPDDEDGDWVLESDEVSDGAAEPTVDDGYLEEDVAADADPEALTEFRPRLAPYGTWIDHPTYGTVWVPSSDAVGPDFAPYVTAGRWDLTPDGDWLWVSDYEWGYIPFHYGRWVWISGVGWSWIPGRVYAPAWVMWRVGPGGYIGWAPYPPSWYWSGGVAFSLWFTPPAAYIFCPTQHVFHHHVHTHVVRTPAEARAAAGMTQVYRPTRARSYRPASPTFEAADVPRSAAPKARNAGDPRALELAKAKPRSEARRASGAAMQRPAEATRPSSSRTLGSAQPSGTRLRTPKTLGSSSSGSSARPTTLPASSHRRSTSLGSSSAPSRLRPAWPAVRNATPGRSTPPPASLGRSSGARGSTTLGAGASPSSRRKASPPPTSAPSRPSAAPSPRRSSPSMSAPSRPSSRPSSSPSRSLGGSGGRRR